MKKEVNRVGRPNKLKAKTAHHFLIFSAMILTISLVSTQVSAITYAEILDPAITDDAQIHQGGGNNNGGGLCVGPTQFDGVFFRSFLQFDTSSLPDKVDKVELQLTSLSTPAVSTTTTRTVQVHEVLSAWTGGGLVATGWSIDNPSIASPFTSQSFIGEESIPYMIDITDLYTKWKTDPSTNHGIVLIDSDESSTGTLDLKCFASTNLENDNVKPKLIITRNVQTVTIQPVDGIEAMIDHDRFDPMGSLVTQLGIGSHPNSGVAGIRRTFIKFPLPNLPPDALFENVALDVFFWRTWGSGTTKVSVYEPLKPWVEDKVTAITYDGTNPWGIAMADSPTDRSFIAMDTLQPILSQMNSLTLDLSLVQRWFSDSTSNYGLLLIDDTESNNQYEIYSSDFNFQEPTLAPRLTLTYATDYITTELQPADGIDTTIRTDITYDNRNCCQQYADAQSLDIGEHPNAPYAYRGLIKFDTSSIPANAIIYEAKLELFVHRMQGDGQTTGSPYPDTSSGTGVSRIAVHDLLRDWTEYGAFEDLYDSLNTWEQSLAAGDLDRNTEKISTIIPVIGQYNTWSLDSETIQSWILDPTSNQGLMLIDESENDALYSFYSSDHPDPAFHPKLTITYRLGVLPDPESAPIPDPTPEPTPQPAPIPDPTPEPTQEIIPPPPTIVFTQQNSSNVNSSFNISETLSGDIDYAILQIHNTTDILTSWMNQTNQTLTIYTALINISTFADGNYTLVKNVTDQSGQTTVNSINFEINISTQELPSTVLITNPSNNSIVVESFNITESIEGIDVDYITYQVTNSFGNITPKINQTNQTPTLYTALINISSFEDGTYTIIKNITSKSGKVTTVSVNILVSHPISQIEPEVVIITPNITITSPANNTLFTSNFNITENITGVDVDYALYQLVNSTDILTSLLNQTNQTLEVYTSSVNISALADGTYTIIKEIYSQAGKKHEASTNFIKLTSAPAFTFNAPQNGQIVSETNTLALTANDIGAGIASISINLDDNPLQVCSYASTALQETCSMGWDSTALPDGNYQLSATVTDTLGNQAVTPARSIIIDNTPPIINFISPKPFSVVNDNFNIIEDITEANPDSIVYEITTSTGSEVLQRNLQAPAGLLWTTSTVDDQGIRGAYSSITQHQNLILISYHDTLTKALHFVKSTDLGESWFQSIPVDTIGQTGLFTSITSPEENTLYISYQDATAPERKLKMAKSTDAGSTFTTKVIDDTGSTGYHSSAHADEQDIYISYYDSTNGDLKLAKSTDAGSTFTLKAVDSTGDVGQHSSIKSVHDAVYISYYDSTNGDLKLAKSTDAGSTFTLSTIDSVADVGKYTSMGVVGDGTIHISYYDSTNGDLKFAKSTDSGVSFNIVTVDIENNVGIASSLESLDAQTILISYADQTGGNLRSAISTDSGKTWTNMAVDITGTVGLTSSITALDKTTVLISYYDATKGNLKVAKSRPGTAIWTSEIDVSLLPDGTYKINKIASDLAGAVTSKSIQFTLDRTPPVSTLTSPRNYELLGGNSIPFTIQGAASDNLEIDSITVEVDNVPHTATGIGLWNVNWAPVRTGTYSINSIAVDTASNQKIKALVSELSVYVALNSFVQNGISINSSINMSNITNSTFISSFIHNLIILNGSVDASIIINSTVIDSVVNLSLIINSFVDPSVVADSNISNSTVTDSNILNSTVINSTVINSTLQDATKIFAIVINSIDISSILTNVNETGSSTINVTASNSIINKSIVANSNINETTLFQSVVSDSYILNSTKLNSTMHNTTILDSNNVNCRLTDTVELSSTCLSSEINGSVLNNSQVTNSTVTNVTLNNAIVIDNRCETGTAVYKELTYSCPRSIVEVYEQCGDAEGTCQEFESCGTCPQDCGICTAEVDEDPQPTQQVQPSSGGGGGGGGRSYCEQKWDCGEWGICKSDSTQKRTCFDINKCEEKQVIRRTLNVISKEPKPEESRDCSYTHSPTCSDDRLNGKEADIDCGGDCVACLDGSFCSVNADCKSNNCLNDFCFSEEIQCISDNDCDNGAVCIDAVCGTVTPQFSDKKEAARTMPIISLILFILAVTLAVIAYHYYTKYIHKKHSMEFQFEEITTKSNGIRSTSRDKLKSNSGKKSKIKKNSTNKSKL
jgi:hypothetical protein